MIAKFLAGVFLALCGIASACPSGAATPIPNPPMRYYVDWAAVRAHPPEPRADSTGDYIFTIVRQAPDTTSSRLLAIAECAYPPRDLLATLAANNGYEIGSDTARVPLWWCKGTAERRTPYAVTRGALDYYLKLVEKYRDNEHRHPAMQPILTCTLYYSARIAMEEDFALGGKSFTNVYVASIGMSWTYDDGTFLPFVAGRRTVVLTPAGQILAVDGDGQSTEEVSISANRGVGRSRELMR